MVMHTAMSGCGYFHGVVGFAKAKGSIVLAALQKVTCYIGYLVVKDFNQKLESVQLKHIRN